MSATILAGMELGTRGRIPNLETPSATSAALSPVKGGAPHHSSHMSSANWYTSAFKPEPVRSMSSGAAARYDSSCSDSARPPASAARASASPAKATMHMALCPSVAGSSSLLGATTAADVRCPWRTPYACRCSMPRATSRHSRTKSHASREPSSPSLDSPSGLDEHNSERTRVLRTLAPRAPRKRSTLSCGGTAAAADTAADSCSHAAAPHSRSSPPSTKSVSVAASPPTVALYIDTKPSEISSSPRSTSASVLNASASISSAVSSGGSEALLMAAATAGESAEAAEAAGEYCCTCSSSAAKPMARRALHVSSPAACLTGCPAPASPPPAAAAPLATASATATKAKATSAGLGASLGAPASAAARATAGDISGEAIAIARCADGVR